MEGVEVARETAGAGLVVALRGDLAAQRVDAVVNAANEHLAHGGGVAAALARAGGPAVGRESERWVAEHGPVRPGQAAVTTAGDLPARVLVHVVGPRYREGQDNERLLRQAVMAALDAAEAQGAASVAMPAISSGVFGYPRAQAAAVIARACLDWLAAGERTLREARLVGFDDAAAADFAAALRR